MSLKAKLLGVSFINHTADLIVLETAEALARMIGKNWQSVLQADTVALSNADFARPSQIICQPD